MVAALAGDEEDDVDPLDSEHPVTRPSVVRTSTKWQISWVAQGGSERPKTTYR
jgi:hypothetical protein